MSATNNSSDYATSLSQFESSGSKLCDAVCTAYPFGPHYSARKDSTQLFAELKPFLVGLSPAYKQEIRRLYGLLTAILEQQAWIQYRVRRYSDGDCKDFNPARYRDIALTNLRIAVKLATRAASRYTDTVAAPPEPRLLVVGIGIQELTTRLLDGKLDPSALDSALFWLIKPRNPLSILTLGQELYRKVRAARGFCQKVTEKILKAQSEGRVAQRSLRSLNEMLARHSIKPVDSSEFIRECCGAPDDIGGVEWTAFAYGFEML